MIRNKSIDKQGIMVFMLSLIAILYCILRSNLILNILSIIIFLYILLKFDAEYCIYALLFFAPWESFSAFPALSYLTVMELMLSVRVLMFFVKNKIRLSLMDFFSFCLLFAYGYISYKVTGKVTIFRMSLIVLFSIFFRQILMQESEEERKDIWRTLFFFVFLTSFFSSIYGYFNILTGLASYSRRLGMFRIGTTLGIDRACLLYCAGMIYPMYYLKQYKWLRSFLLTFFAISLLLTVSMTAIITFATFIILYFCFELKDTDSRRKNNLLIGILIFLTIFAIIWNFGSGLEVIDNAVNRVKSTMYYLEIGDYSNATTTRSDIFEEYQGTLESMTSKERLFGTGYTSFYNYGLFSHYSHNTILDMYTCFGIIPMAFLFLRRLRNVFIQKKICESSFVKLVLIEVVYLLPCLSVSMLAQGYWFYIFLLL